MCGRFVDPDLRSEGLDTSWLKINPIPRRFNVRPSGLVLILATPRRSRRRPTIDATTPIETGACMNDGATHQRRALEGNGGDVVVIIARRGAPILPLDH